MSLYPKNEKPLTDELFKNPTSEYRGTPFWAWNCQMTEEKITMIIDAMKEMGLGGGHIHCRTGMNNPYLSEEFMDLVEDAHTKFKERDMITWLYDEDRWPSGAAGGLVTKDHQYRMRFLVFTPKRAEAVEDTTGGSSGSAVRSNERKLLAHYQVQLEHGWLKDYRRLGEQEEAKDGWDEWFAYLEVSGDNAWFNNQAYVNTLDKKAIDRFIEETHEAYARRFQDEFGKTIPAIFTDEPQFCRKTRLHYATDKMDVIIPYTDDLEETFTKTYGHSLLDALPEVFWEKEGDMVSAIRYQYHDHICERFVTAFADNVGGWCKEHGLMLTGHMMEEPTLLSQTAALGEAMRSYRSFQLPGIDMLCDRRELSTAKQAQSAAHQYGYPGVLSELYGVTNWDFDFRGHKLQGDWQAALGVTVRVHHLTWTSMAGEAKRDYPAPIGYQSPWYKEYRYVEDYFARINTVMTRGKADVKIGVIHPIESYWLYWGSEEKTGSIREEMDENFEKLIQWMLFGNLDFDFISESLLPEQTALEHITENGFPVGEMQYDVILVPNCTTLRKTTVERLKAFREQGGTVVFAGHLPSYQDAVFSAETNAFAKSCTCVPFTRTSLLDALEEYRVVEIRNGEGLMADNLIYQMRTENDKKLFFLAHVNKMADADIPKKEEMTITLKGCYDVLCYEPLDGTKKYLKVTHKNGTTVIKRTMYDHDSLLLELSPAADLQGEEEQREAMDWTPIRISNALPYHLSEPNVLILDQAEYAFDHGEWQPKEELLLIDNEFRKQLGYQLRMEAFPQPWVDQSTEEIKHTLSLRFSIQSEVNVERVTLALENQTATIFWNGQKIPTEITGWYVDKQIVTVALGDVKAGENELIVEIPYHKKEDIEYMFLLGEFGVRVSGAEAVLTSLPEKMAFGDIVPQGFPFYGGNVEYEIPVTLPEDGVLKVHASKYRNPLLKAELGEQTGVIAYSPYSVTLDGKAGEQVLRLTAFGNRFNTFGTLHNCNESQDWFGPNTWRTTGDEWSYEYQLKRTGLLKAPMLYWRKG